MPTPKTQAWPRLKDLHDLVLAGDAATQRRLLRLHEETGFGPQHQSEIQFRADLDAELARIMDAEFRAQCGARATGTAAGRIPYFADLMKRSPAFVQYLNVCLYFDVRFAGGRIFDPCRPPEFKKSDCNEPTMALPPPLMCQETWKNAGVVEKFLKLARTIDYQEPAATALHFLDGFTAAGEKIEARARDDDEDGQFELWLKRLFFKSAGGAAEEKEFALKQAYFSNLEKGILAWARSRYTFYTDLERNNPDKSAWVSEWKRKTEQVWKEGLWTVNNPISARCALVDFYWLAKMLRADVSQNGEVTYRERSWLYLLAVRTDTQPGLTENAKQKRKAYILRIEEVLRSAFAYACDVIQNAVEIANECADWHAHRESFAFPPAAIEDSGPQVGSWRPEAWREVEDLEHIEIAFHRKERDHESIPGGGRLTNHSSCAERAKPRGWSRRVWTGEQLDNVIGLAFSGGGIRSATFNLGVLQKLQELDLLRQIDYLSTVSGGGYIGSWLVGNVRRTRYWLSRMINWDASIEHLRRYSNYLAPRNGILSPDTWSIGLTWMRNAFFIQITAFVWLAVILISSLNLKWLIFEWARDGQTNGFSAPHWFLVGSMLLVLLIDLFFLWQERPPERSPLRDIFVRGNALTIAAAVLAWFACLLTAGLLWGQVRSGPGDYTKFSTVLKIAYTRWFCGVIPLFCSAIALIAIASVIKHKVRRISLRNMVKKLRPKHRKIARLLFKARKIARAVLKFAGYISAEKLVAFAFTLPLVPAITYLALCAELRIFGALLEHAHLWPNIERLDWIVFAVGPFISMIAVGPPHQSDKNGDGQV